MARFEVIAGRHITAGKLIKKGEVFDTKTDKEAEFCCKYPDKFRELTTPVYGGRRGTTTVRPMAKPEEDAGPTIHDVEGHKDTANSDEEPGHESDTDDEVVEVDMTRVEKMSLPELKKFVVEYSIDAKGAKTKEDYLVIIRKNVEG